jgi:hypothetical protein
MRTERGGAAGAIISKTASPIAVASAKGTNQSRDSSRRWPRPSPIASLYFGVQSASRSAERNYDPLTQGSLKTGQTFPYPIRANMGSVISIP